MVIILESAKWLIGISYCFLSILLITPKSEEPEMVRRPFTIDAVVVMLGYEKRVTQPYILILIFQRVKIPDWSSGGWQGSRTWPTRLLAHAGEQMLNEIEVRVGWKDKAVMTTIFFKLY